MLHQLHHTFLPLEERRPARTQVLASRGRRWAIKRRLRELLRAPAMRIPLGVHHV
jgi:hypothetical protein